MIIDNQIRDLVGNIDTASGRNNSSSLEVDKNIRELITQLRHACDKSENQLKYNSYSRISGELGKYPVDNEKFAIGFDPLVNEEDFYDCWKNYGVVVNPIRSGSLVSWDSRTTHSNSENISNDIRMVAYIATGPAKEESSQLISARETAFLSGLAYYDHEGLGRVTQKPRFTDQQLIKLVRKPEQLHLLGQLLYGKRSYKTA